MKEYRPHRDWSPLMAVEVPQLGAADAHAIYLCAVDGLKEECMEA